VRWGLQVAERPGPTAQLRLRPRGKPSSEEESTPQPASGASAPRVCEASGPSRFRSAVSRGSRSREACVIRGEASGESGSGRREVDNDERTWVFLVFDRTRVAAATRHLPARRGKIQGRTEAAKWANRSQPLQLFPRPAFCWGRPRTRSPRSDAKSSARSRRLAWTNTLGLYKPSELGRRL
jgi:hypothetical protein